jgi:hypothetical protein
LEGAGTQAALSLTTGNQPTVRRKGYCKGAVVFSISASDDSCSISQSPNGQVAEVVANSQQ